MSYAELFRVYKTLLNFICQTFIVEVTFNTDMFACLAQHTFLPSPSHDYNSLLKWESLVLLQLGQGTLLVPEV
jgi:hypothetical protein